MVLSVFQHLAASKGYEDIVQFLLQKKAGVNIIGESSHLQMSLGVFEFCPCIQVLLAIKL